MHEIIQFIIENWLLVLMLFMVIFLIFMEESQANETARGGVPSDEVSQLLHKGYKIIDLRSEKDFDKGHIPASKNMTTDKLDKLNFRSIDTSKWILCCADGEASSKCALSLKEEKSVDVKYLSGGIKSWTETGFTLTKK